MGRRFGTNSFIKQFYGKIYNWIGRDPRRAILGELRRPLGPKNLAFEFNLKPVFTQITPVEVSRFDQFYPLFPEPSFDLFLPFNSGLSIYCLFKKDEPVYAVPLGKTGNGAGPVFVQASFEVAGNSRVKSPGRIGENVDEKFFHGKSKGEILRRLPGRLL